MLKNHNFRTVLNSPSRSPLLFLLFFIGATLTACGGGGGGGSNGGSGGTVSAASLYVYGIAPGASSTTPGTVVVTSLDSSGAVISTKSYPGVTESAPFAEATATVGGQNFLYVVNPNSNTIDEFSVSDLTVTKLGSVSTGVGPESVSVDNANRFVFVGDTNNTTVGGGDVYSYSINTNGTLTPVGTPAFNNADPVYGVQEDTTGTYLVAACQISNTGWEAKSLKVNSDGTLTLVASSAEVAAFSPQYFLVVPNTTNGDILYAGAPEFSPAAHSYTVVLTATSVTLTNATGSSGEFISPVWVDPSGTWLFEATFNGSTNAELLNQYKIGASGALTAGSQSTQTLASGSGDTFGGFTNSVSGYISTSGTVIVPYGGAGSSLVYNSINGYLSNPATVYLGGVGGNAAFLP